MTKDVPLLQRKSYLLISFHWIAFCTCPNRIFTGEGTIFIGGGWEREGGGEFSWQEFFMGGFQEGGNVPGTFWLNRKKKAVKNLSKNCAFRKQCRKNVRFLSFPVSKRFSENCPPRNFSKFLNEVGIFYTFYKRRTIMLQTLNENVELNYIHKIE